MRWCSRPNRETVAGQPVILARPGEVLDPPQAPSPKPNIVPIVTEQAILSPSAAEQRPKRHWSEAELSDVKPQTFNIDFGSGAPSKQVGPAAAGRAGDFWNTASVAFNDHHTESDLKFAGGNPSPIEVEMINLGGGWSFHGAMGVKSPMLDTYNYPAGNKGGNSTVILHQVPRRQIQRLYLRPRPECGILWRLHAQRGRPQIWPEANLVHGAGRAVHQVGGRHPVCQILQREGWRGRRNGDSHSAGGAVLRALRAQFLRRDDLRPAAYPGEIGRGRRRGQRVLRHCLASDSAAWLGHGQTT